MSTASPPSAAPVRRCCRAICRSPVKATFRDLVPPPAPATLTPLIETKAVRLIWAAVEAPDLAGYRLYRTEGVGHGTRHQGDRHDSARGGRSVTATDYVDARVDLGIAYRYAVTAVDKTGNESARVWTDWVVAPKTP